MIVRKQRSLTRLNALHKSDYELSLLGLAALRRRLLMSSPASPTSRQSAPSAAALELADQPRRHPRLTEVRRGLHRMGKFGLPTAWQIGSVSVVFRLTKGLHVSWRNEPDRASQLDDKRAQ
jgi:hypothetical protein